MLVDEGQKFDIPLSMNYVSVVSRDSIRNMMMLVDLNGLNFYAMM